MQDFVHKELYCPWVVPIAPSWIRDFVTHKGIKRTYKKNNSLISNEQDIKNLFYIDSGWCHYSVSFKENKEVYMMLYLPGSMFYSTLDCMSGTVQAGTACNIYELPVSLMKEKTMSNTHDCVSLYNYVLMSFSCATFGLMLNNQFEIEARLAVFLQMLSLRANIEVAKGYYSIRCKMSHDYIHHFINANRVTVSKIMGEWHRDGTIIYVNNIIAISQKLHTAKLFR